MSVFMQVPIVEKTFSLPQSLFERVWASQQSAPVTTNHSATSLSGSTAHALRRRRTGDYVTDLSLNEVKRPRLIPSKESLDKQTNLQIGEQEKWRVNETQRQDKTTNGVWKPFEQQGILDLTSKPRGTLYLEALHSQFLTTLRKQGSSEAGNVIMLNQGARTHEARHEPSRKTTYGTISLAGVALNHKTYPKIVAVHSLMNNSSESSLRLNRHVAGAASPVSRHCKESGLSAKNECLENVENRTLINKPSLGDNVLRSEDHQPDALFPNNDDDDVVVIRVVSRNVSLSKETASQGEQAQKVDVRKDDDDSFKNTSDPGRHGLVGQKANTFAVEHLGSFGYPRGGDPSRHYPSIGNRCDRVNDPEPFVEPLQEQKPRSVQCAVDDLLSLPRSGDPSRHDSTEIGHPSNRFNDPKRIEPSKEQRPCSVNHPLSLPRCGDPLRHSEPTEIGNPSNRFNDPKDTEPLHDQRPCSVKCNVNHPVTLPRCGDPLGDSSATESVHLPAHMEHPKSGINPSLPELQLNQSEGQVPVLSLTEKSEATKEGNDAKEKCEERLRTASKITKTVSEISQKIIETRGRMKHETIEWKKAVLVRLERHLIKKLRRVEHLTGEKTEIKDLQQADSDLVTKGSKSKGQGKERPVRRKTVTEDGCSAIKDQSKNVTDKVDSAVESNEEKLGDSSSIDGFETLVVSRNPDVHTFIQKQGQKQESESLHIEKDEKREGSQEVEVSSKQTTSNLEETEDKAKDKATDEEQSLQSEGTNRNSFLRDKSGDVVDCEANEELCEVIATQKEKPLVKDVQKSTEFSGVANKIKLDEDLAEDASQGQHKRSCVAMTDAGVQLQAENMREENVFNAVSIEQRGHESLRKHQCLQVADVKPLTINDLHSSSTANKVDKTISKNAASLKSKLDSLVKTCLDVKPKTLNCERNIWSSLEKQGII
ncbi:uncharacterized protein [Acropora muricata]|uniref:uncharacterized protein n=1 Tax=Acropora muricata TaxID=159855 RepID=UPI0034E387AA